MYYDLLEKIETELKNDDFITTVTEGNIFDIDMTKITLFPLAHVQVTNATFNENVISFNINIYCMDITDVSKDETTNLFRGNDNSHDILNTTLAVLNRFYEKIRRGDLYTEGYQVDGGPTCEPFEENFTNKLTGWNLQLSIKVPNTMTVCDV